MSGLRNLLKERFYGITESIHLRIYAKSFLPAFLKRPKTN